jgi:hypothetical protein
MPERTDRPAVALVAVFRKSRREEDSEIVGGFMMVGVKNGSGGKILPETASCRQVFCRVPIWRKFRAACAD